MLREVHAYYSSVYRFDSSGSLGVASAGKLDSITILQNQRFKQWIIGEWKWLSRQISWPDIPSIQASSTSIVFDEKKIKLISNDSIIWEHDYCFRAYREGRWSFIDIIEIPAINAVWHFDFDYWAKKDKAPRSLYILRLPIDNDSFSGYYQKVEYW